MYYNKFMKNNNISLKSFIKLMILDFNILLRNFVILTSIFLISYFLFWKTENNKYVLYSNIKPMSYINFTKIFTYDDVELIVQDGKHKRALNSLDDNFIKRRLTPLVIFYHFISILENEFDEEIVKNENNNKKFIHFEKIWNQTQIIYNFDIKVYGNDAIFLQEKFDTVIEKSTTILKNDIINYLEKYKKQSIDNPEKISKINNSIEQVKNLNKALRISQFKVSKVTNKNTLILILGLITSLIASICIQLITYDLKKTKKK